MSKLRRNKGSSTSSNNASQQVKISSFFQKTSSVPVVQQSNLFTHVGSLDTRTSASGCQQPPGKDYTSSRINHAQSDKVLSVLNSDGIDTSESAENLRPVVERQSVGPNEEEIIDLCDHKDAIGVDSESRCVPDTQPNLSRSPCSTLTNILDVSADDVIPDTPVGNSERADRRKFQRSYLSSSTSLRGLRKTDRKLALKSGKTKSVECRLKQHVPVSKVHVEEAENRTKFAPLFANPPSNSSELESTKNIPIDEIPVSSTSMVLKRPVTTEILPAAKRIDHRTTPKKSDDNSVGSTLATNAIPCRTFDEMLNREKNRSTVQSAAPVWGLKRDAKCRLRKPISRQISESRLDCSELDADDDLLDVLNELKMDSHRKSENVEKSTNMVVGKDAKSSPVIDSVSVGKPMECDRSLNGKEWNNSLIYSADPELDSVLAELRQQVSPENGPGKNGPGKSSSTSEKPQPSSTNTVHQRFSPAEHCMVKLAVSADLVSEKLSDKMSSDISRSVSVETCSESISSVPDSCIINVDLETRVVAPAAPAPAVIVIDDASTTTDSLVEMCTDDWENWTDDCEIIQNDSVDLKRFPPAFHKFGRHTVTGTRRNGKQLVLDLMSAVDNQSRKAILEGFWTDALVSAGDVVNVVGEFDRDGVCRVTNLGNFLVVEPDFLISGTSIVNSVYCMRRAVLNEKIRGLDGRNVFMLNGSIIHYIFQQVIVRKAMTQSAIDAVIDEAMKQHHFLLDIYALGLTESVIRSEVENYRPQMLTFLQKNCASKNSANSCSSEIVVTNVVDIEENIWSPRFGIKGKIDMTVEVKVHGRNNNSAKTTPAGPVPLELKTGKTTFSAEHKGQVTLYAMMCSERRQEVEAGILLYLKDLSMQMVPANYANKRGLIQLRNEMAHYIRRSADKLVPITDSEESDSCWPFGSLPEPINNERSCTGCPQLLPCCLYQRIEGWEPASSAHTMAKLVPGTLSHLSDEHLGYFSLWCRLLHLESAAERRQHSQNGASAIWLQTSIEREKAGTCLGRLSLVSAECRQLGVDVYQQVFARSVASSGFLPLCDVGISAGDSLVVSAENRPYISLTTGTVVAIDSRSVTVVADRDLREYDDNGGTVYRLDRCDTYNSMGSHLANVARLMENTPVSEKLRSLIIDRATPQFLSTLPKSGINKVEDIIRQLNKPQKVAILKVLMSKDYVLIKGYPGTGKTSTIVALIRVLVRLGQSVLLASYTHSAVDNILVKLRKHDDVDFVRLGRRARVHPSVADRCDETLTSDMTTVKQLEDFYASKPVIATTCLGVNHAVFARRTFDVCIVDEASQVSLPACVGTLFPCRRFVLVGDPKQLPPVVQSHEARELGMSESLFVRLDSSVATYELNLQYRMNREIMKLSNELVYSGVLRCANDGVADGRLDTKTDALNNVSDSGCPEDSWLSRCVSSRAGDEVLWLNVDPLLKQCVETRTTGPSRVRGAGVHSKLEATIVRTVVHRLVQATVNTDDIGVITPYRQQVRLLRDVLRSAGLSTIEVNTVDQYQGRDKLAIIISFVKSTPSVSNVAADAYDSTHTPINEILNDERRLNVALTRARHKLIFVGSVETLQTYAPLHQLLNVILVPHQILEVRQLPAAK